MNKNPYLSAALQENAFTLTLEMQQQLDTYLTLLQKWNKVFNLTAIRDSRDMVYLHIIDSLAISPFLHGTRMLDVGSGAGLPGLPLAITHPEQQWTLLDKGEKKTRFMTQAVVELGLKNITIVNARCEDFHSELGFDSIVSRAFSALSMMLEKTKHLIAANGIFVAMKGAQMVTELEELPEGFSVLAVQPIKITGINVERHVICVRLGTDIVSYLKG